MSVPDGGYSRNASCTLNLISTFYYSYLIKLFNCYFTGIGKSLAYQPGLVVVGEHFAKKRGVAVGLATAGGGIGTLVFPPLFELLLTYYGFSGGLMIISGIALNMSISGMLYQSSLENRTLRSQSLM